ncbi:sodium- and chloride-dependent neutral and basic amino acid transporter B(0+)-like, partial [Pollicipes pollicipes]|uniref:sodium- and chloride-dependent neutral and basic amino acid transporter B(0+)-like n=1 Tax=Pollicipes pollicipes TaxID=41117 RepID=UPI001884A709
SSPAAERSASGGGRANRLLSRGSSFLGVYQTVPELSAEEESRRAARGYWQHNYSSPLACLTCTVGLGAVCRFALFGGTYGVAFIIQFFILSLLVGMPLMTLHMTLGQYIGSGVVDMWRISPIFKGIGLAAIFAELLLGVYTVVPTAWMLVYLRDSFVSSYDRYKWAACPGNCSVGYAELVTYTVPQYFNQRVLQRDMSNTGLPEVGYLGFEISFNLAVTWILVYLSLGRGLRSYGKVVYPIVLLAMVSFFTVCIQLLSWTEGLNEFFTDKVLFDNVFWSTVPWVVAARETFMIWGLHGAALMAVASHNKFGHSLRRDTSLVALVTLVILFLAALFGYACLHALRVGDIGYIIGSSSFETEQRSRFLIAPGIGSSHSGGTPPEVKHYTNLVSGVIIRLSGSAGQTGTQWSSGYQVHRLATELFPSLLAVVGGSGISSFWALVFYLSLLLFGVGQQLAIWRAVVEAVISVCPRRLRAWELTTTFFMCVFGFGLSLPLMTEIGIHIIYFLDYCVGCLWWLVVIFVLELFAVFYIRGSPFASTQVVTILIARNSCMTNWAGPFLSFVWHVLLPMALLVLSVVSFRTGGFDAIFTWEESSGYGFWGLWVRQLGSMLMMFPILLVPVVGLIQAIRFIRKGEGDLYDRIQGLYRPEYNEAILGRITPEEEDRGVPRTRTRYTDPPPKYTPPPSYSTATGARLAKMVRQSVRRSMRHVRQLASPERGAAAAEAGQAAAATGSRTVPDEPPPSYASLLLETLPAPLRRSVRRLGSSLPDSVLETTLTEEEVPVETEPDAA